MAPTWAAGPSKVVVSPGRGTKITKTYFSTRFLSKVGPSPFKSRSNGPKMTTRAPTGAQMTPTRRPRDLQNRAKILKNWSQWQPERHLDPQMSPGGYIGAKIRLKRCFFIRHIRKTLAVGMPILWKIYHKDSDCSLRRVCPPSCQDPLSYHMIRRRSNKSIEKI